MTRRRRKQTDWHIVMVLALGVVVFLFQDAIRTAPADQQLAVVALGVGVLVVGMWIEIRAMRRGGHHGLAWLWTVVTVVLIGLVFSGVGGLVVWR